MNTWIRWCKRYADGNANWEYFYYTDKEEFITDYIESQYIDGYDQMSDKYRGVKFEIIGAPPMEFLTNTKENTLRQIAGLQKYLEFLELEINRIS